jgi:hypothetical protein
MPSKLYLTHFAKKKKEGFISPYHEVNFSVAIFHHFKKNILEKEIKKKKIKTKIIKNFHNCLYNMKGYLKIFLLSYFEYRQHWLNILMDDCHSSKITKLKNKNMDIIC